MGRRLKLSFPFTAMLIACFIYTLTLIKPNNLRVLLHSKTQKNLGHCNRECSNISWKCSKEKRHIVFIKTHKTGSSSIANILFRFGFSRNLTFLLPRELVTITLDLNTPWTNYLPLPPGRNHYDILTSHSMYVRSEIDRLFPTDRVVISILRHPLSQLESSIYYYHSDGIRGDDKVGEYLKNPSILKGDHRYVNNSMAYELGVPMHQFFNRKFVKKHVEHLAEEIDFVIIMERMEESLVYLKRVLCWSLKDIIFFKRNVNYQKPNVKRTDQEIQKYEQMSPANYIVYDYFYKLFEDSLETVSRLREEVNHFSATLAKVESFCQSINSTSNCLKINASDWNNEFVITKRDCEILMFSGLDVFAEANRYQYG